MNKPRLRLRGKIGRSYGVIPDDTRDIKTALREFGYYHEPSFGITPYPDENLFEGIEAFQDDFDLQKDGLVTPGGETERKLNEIAALKEPLALGRASSGPADPGLPGIGPSLGEGPNPPLPNAKEEDQEQHAALPAVIPVVVYEVAVFFGMTLSAAYAWWISRSPDEKQRIEEQIRNFEGKGDSEPSRESRCEALYEIDSDTCRQVSKKRSNDAGRRCWASAAERYSACLKGRPVNELPPLDIWNN